MKKFFLFISIISISLCYVSCTKEDNQEPDSRIGFTKVSEGYAAGAATKVEIYTDKTTISAGYTKFYIALYDSVSGKRIDEANI